MEIVKIPDPVLRQKAREVTEVDRKLEQFVGELQETLRTHIPRGIGLAAPQVNKLRRIFTTRIKRPRVYINPVIVKHSGDMILGQNRKEPFMEGCLSMPRIWGPVPRWEWIDLEFQSLSAGKLINAKQRFEADEARIIQHEIDHLDGILFTDHSLKYDMPVYQETDDDSYIELDKEFLEMI